MPQLECHTGEVPGRKYGPTTVITEHDRRRLIAARHRLRYSLDQLGRRVGLNRGTLYKIESGKVNATAKLAELYKVLKLPLDLLGKPDPDELELLEAYRKVKSSLPGKAEDVIRAVAKLADEAEAVRRRRDEVEAEERGLKLTP